MAERTETGEPAAGNRLLLAYVQHMARTAQCDSARYLFEMFARQEKRRLKVNDGLRLPAS